MDYYHIDYPIGLSAVRRLLSHLAYTGRGFTFTDYGLSTPPLPGSLEVSLWEGNILLQSARTNGGGFDHVLHLLLDIVEAKDRQVREIPHGA